MGYIWLTGIVIILFILLYRFLSPQGRDIFCPFYLVSLLYFIIFVYGPAYYLKRGISVVEGIEALSYTSEATVAFLSGYFTYFLGSILGSRSPNRKQERVFQTEEQSDKGLKEFENRYVIKYAWIVYFGGLALGTVYYLLIGRSLAMMLSFGQLGEKSALSASGSYAFLVYFMDFPIGALLLLHTFSKRKTMVWIATILYAIMTTTAGFRYLPMCFALALVTNYFLQRGKRPGVFKSLGAILFAYLFVGIVGVFRGAMKTGGAIDWSLVSADTIANSFRNNSDIFFPFYCIVHYMNKGWVSCHYGLGVLYVFVFAIPRFLWPSKPTALGKTAFEAMWGSNLGGAAYPNIGEFFYEFGFFGMLVCMFILGLLLEKRFKMTLKKKDEIDIIKYSILFSYLLQFVNRGYIAGWVYDLVFFLFPIWLLDFLKNRRFHRQSL